MTVIEAAKNHMYPKDPSTVLSANTFGGRSARSCISSSLVKFARHHARIWIEKVRVLEHLNQRKPENEFEIIRLCTVQVEEISMLFANAQAWTAIEGSAVIWRPDLHNKKQTNDANDSPSSQPNVHIDPKSKDDRFKLQIRGSMLVALMVAAWERRSEALASSDENGLAPSEPIIQPAHPYAPLHPIQRDISNRPAVLSHTDMPRQQDFRSRDVHSSGQQYQTSQQVHANVDFNEDLATFLDPVLGATSSTYDDMLSLNSLLQSSVGLDSTSWLGSTLGPTPEDGVEIKGPSSLTEFLPSL
ncbi:uncharacterized protein UBRO2_05122 [Ustilago bromivora]|uniref:Uncharacterized protein n=1 Tax=Ustilago bromivora TaxID=307758 RepID=A0A8H8QR75_9BASI|nr:uncharacterized protein UBRO2_05122 [Ustilago bromivora]